MHIGKNNPGLPYSIDGTQIDSVTTEKDIGFWISNDLLGVDTKGEDESHVV